MTPVPHSLDDLQDFLDAHGADPRRWPAGLAAALALRFKTDPAAAAMLARAARLEALIEASVDPAPAFDPKAAIRAAGATAQATPLGVGPRPSLGVTSLGSRLRPVLALAASLFLGFLVGASGWMPGGRPFLAVDGADFIILTEDSFSLEDAP